ncbi:MAG: ATP--guanido phosphotransferase [Leptospira bouyouniensis]
MMFCRFCGTTDSQFRISGKFGCEHCALQFSYPLKKNQSPIPKSLIDEIERIFTKSDSKIRILSVRTRLTRNLRHNLFPFYDVKEEEVKRLLDENRFLELLNLGTNPILEKINPMVRLYLGGEDHLRLEIIWTAETENTLQTFPIQQVSKERHINIKSLLRFFFQKQHWAFANGFGYIASCPTNLGRGRRDSLLLGIEPGVDPSFFSLFDKLSEFGIEFAPSTDHRRESLGNFRGLVVKISWKNAFAVQKRKFYKILGLRGSL